MFMADRAHHHSSIHVYRKFSYNDLYVVQGQHCRSTLAHHYVYRLKQYDTNRDG